MKYTVLGSGSCVPDEKKNSSGGILEVGSILMLVDCGTGVLHAIPRSGYDYKQIDAVCLTHLHLDHVNDFGALLFAMAHDPECHREKELFVIAPKGFTQFYENLKKLYGDTLDAPFEIVIREMGNEEFDYGDIHIQTLQTFHTENSIGYRFTYKGKVVCISGDTSYNENIVTLCKDADLAVLECSFPQMQEEGIHLNPKLISKIVTEAHVKEVLLTHLYPHTEDYPIVEYITREYDGDIAIAQVGKTYKI
jgi:ribonuclease BN (tRNA processing enzyme)